MARDLLLDLAHKGTLKYTALALQTDPPEYCETERHVGGYVPADLLFLVYTPDPEKIMRVHLFFPTCGECDEMRRTTPDGHSE